MILSQKVSLFFKFLAVLCVLPKVYSVGQVIYAINAGGDAHTDIHGVNYEKDSLNVGIASDYGKKLLIGRVPPKDHILYQTERYHTNTFGYDLPLPSDGQYVLILKFCEVYFESPDQKVFDVVLNGEHTVVPDLDIFSKVDKGVAHDEYVPFEVNQGKLYVNGEESEIQGNKVRLEFIKGYKDNPKINAFYLIKGTLDDVPKLPPLMTNEIKEKEAQQPNLQYDEDEEEKQTNRRPRIIPTIPESEEPEESSIMLPVFIVIGAFIPILFFLCKL